jgi:hypothetical protein
MEKSLPVLLRRAALGAPSGAQVVTVDACILAMRQPPPQLDMPHI